MTQVAPLYTCFNLLPGDCQIRLRCPSFPHYLNVPVLKIEMMFVIADQDDMRDEQTR